MERPEYLHRKLTLIKLIALCAVFLCNHCIPARAQQPTSISIYNAYIQGDMDAWLTVIRQMESQPPLTDAQKLDLISYYYGYTAYLIGNDRKKEARENIKTAEKLIDEMLKENSSFDVPLMAFKGSFIGYKLGLNKFKAITLGPESMKYIKRAYRKDPGNVQAIADMANMLYYAPDIFGGDKKEAVRLYKKAVSTLEQNNQWRHNWFYLNILVTLAQHYDSVKQPDEAREIYEKILNIEPGFRWVSEELYHPQ